MKPRVLDLFAGAAGGWSLGLHRAGYETIAACEADPWRRACYARNFPAVRLYDDVRTLDARRLVADLGRIDVVAGSPPCQDASLANTKGRGIDGDRTGLFFEFIRLVGQLRPRWVAAENVPGIRARGIDRVLARLEAEGYAVWPLVVGAVHAGAPHLRKRVVIVAHDADADGKGGRGCAGDGREMGGRMAEFPRHADDAPYVVEPIGRVQRRARADAIRVSEAADANRQHGDTGGHAAGAMGRERSTATGLSGLAADADGRARRSGTDPRQERDRPEPAIGAGGHAAADADGAGLAQRQGERSDGEEEFARAERGRRAAQHPWADPPDIGRMDDGFPRGVARAAVAAYGDAFMPQLAEAIGRAILAADPELIR